MARIRTVKPEYWKSERLATQLPGHDGREARRLFIALWNFAEDHGVCRGSPAYLRAEAYPYDEDVTTADVARWLGMLEVGGFIVRYQRDGSSYLWVRGFAEHQKIDRPSKTTLPEPSHEEREHCASPRRALDEPSLLEGKGREGKGRGEEVLPVAVAPDAVKVLVAQAPLLPEAVAEEAESTGTAPAALQALWNRLAVPKGLQYWKSMSRSRLGASRAALAAVPDLAQWEAWLTYELSRPWNLGENDRGWRADVNWLLAAKRRDSVADFNPAAVPVVDDRSRPRLGPNPVTAAPTGDRPRL